ncbi:amidohydrolase [Kribbella pittospori]|uniref:Amidohydrolase n=1 Tax=Kribbella pittospori TaxID=722689 RepID=A0A4R0KN00_9ACTN|nr:amidohydrolase family protein [Kribbella pittospori]TCC62163.1 amidohydrolase [Kribbella pittospori]
MIDAHVHVWDIERRKLPWLPPGHPLRRDFTLDDLSDDDVVLVQADADPLEVTDLLDLAARTPSVLGVVGWFDLLDPPEYFPEDPRLVGIRSPPVDQTDPDVLIDPAHVRGVRAATAAGLAIDLLLRPPALIGAARLAEAVPDARLVLDHLGNPQTADTTWRTGMKALAAAPNVTVKLSGTAHLPPDDLAELVDVALDLFGSDRLMFGSDWPVSTLSAGRSEVVRRTADLLPSATHNDVFRGTAQRTYRPRETAP